MPNAKPINKKPAKKLDLYDARMIQVMEFVITNGINKIETKGEFLKSIGFPYQNLYQVMSGSQSFRPDNFQAACEIYGVDGNFFLKKKHLAMFSESKKLSPLLQLKDAVALVERELKEK